MDGWAPAGWPREVRPPGVEGWEGDAARWLLDQGPPELRGYPVLRRHVVVLARVVVVHLAASAEGVRRGLGAVRTDLQGHVEPGVVAQSVDVLLAEEARLRGVRRAAGLVEDALRGRRFTPRL